jgi:prephenate dehydrogenase
MRSVNDLHSDTAWRVSASGFRDTTRLAATDPRMMLDILVTNKEAILEKLKVYRDELEGIILRLGSGDEEAMAQWVVEIQRLHNAYRSLTETKEI